MHIEIKKSDADQLQSGLRMRLLDCDICGKTGVVGLEAYNDYTYDDRVVSESKICKACIDRAHLKFVIEPEGIQSDIDNDGQPTFRLASLQGLPQFEHEKSELREKTEKEKKKGDGYWENR